MQVVDGVGAETEFGEDDQIDVLLAGLTDQRLMFDRVGLGISDVDDRSCRGDTHEAMGAARMERVGFGQGEVLRGLMLI